jgi:hypothetical protein
MTIVDFIRRRFHGPERNRTVLYKLEELVKREEKEMGLCRHIVPDNVFYFC